jgi:hypothetical protein
MSNKPNPVAWALNPDGRGQQFGMKRKELSMRVASLPGPPPGARNRRSFVIGVGPPLLPQRDLLGLLP